MKKTEPPVTATDEAAEQVLWDCLAEIPFVKVQKVEQRIISDPGRPEIIARINTAKGDRLILAEVKPNGQPRLIREAISEILKYRQDYADAYGLVIAPLITPQSAAICKQEGIGYLDFSGNCLVNFDFVYINKTGRSVPISKKKKFRSWFSPRAERVLRLLLMHPQRLWKIRELANEAYVTPNQALNIKHHLARRQWLEDSGKGFRLAKPDLLLDEWSSNYLPGRSTERVFASPKTTIEIEMNLASVCQERIIPYALMGFSAAMRFDPTLHHDRVSAYVLCDLSNIVTAQLMDPLRRRRVAGRRAIRSCENYHAPPIVSRLDQFGRARRKSRQLHLAKFYQRQVGGDAACGLKLPAPGAAAKSPSGR